LVHISHKVQFIYFLKKIPQNTFNSALLNINFSHITKSQMGAEIAGDGGSKVVMSNISFGSSVRY
jgi:hypothetical protein